MRRFSTRLLANVTCTFLSALIVLCTPYAQNFMFGSDQLTIPSFAEDYLRNPLFSTTSWMIPRAPYVFPDLLAYSIFRFLTKDAYLSILFILLTYILILYTSAYLILKRSIVDHSKTDIAWYTFLAMSLLILAASQSALTSSFVEAALVIQPYLSIAHGTAAVSAIFAFCIYESILEKRSIFIYVISIPLCSLAIFSDKLFIVFFIIPYLCSIFLTSPTISGLKRLGIISANFGLSLSIALYLDSLFSQQNMDPFGFPVWERAAVIASVFDRSPISFLLLFGTCISVGILGIRVLFSLPKKTMENARETRAQAFIVLLAGAGLGVGLLLWKTSDPAYARYLVGLQIGGLLSTCVLIANLRTVVSRYIIFAASAALSAALLMVSLKPASALAPFEERTRITEGLNACRERMDLKGGYAQYWMARKLSMMTGWAFQINQFEPGYPLPFFWGNNLSWYYYQIDNGQPLMSNFIIDDALKQNDIIRIYGEPTEIADCGGLQVLKYEDSTELQRRVYAALDNRYDLTQLTSRFPAGFDGIATPLHPYQMSAFSRQVGSIENGHASASSDRDSAGFLMFGPYIKLSSGHYILDIVFRCQNITTPNRFDVTAEQGSRILQHNVLPTDDPRCDGNSHRLSMAFEINTMTSNIEFRGFFGGTGTLKIESVNLSAAPR